MALGKYSIGVGDRFGCQGEAQLKAIIKAKNKGVPITPVWNKSNREHSTIHSFPEDVREEADSAVKTLEWTDNYFVDADHINLDTVDKFIDSSDFFTLDVADYIGKPSDEAETQRFLEKNKKYLGTLSIPGIDAPYTITQDILSTIASRYLYATKSASEIYEHIAEKKGKENFIPEVSMDEVETPQTPVELFFILSALNMYGVPAQTIAPKFTGRFNKGVDYVGDTKQFAREFEEDLMVIDFAIQEFGLPASLKLSVHSGSDKFAIYPIMGELIKKYDKGIHVKTAGTTWCEEMIGLAMAGEGALELAKAIYRKGFDRKQELCAPYASVIDIDYSNLPTPEEVDTWSGSTFAHTLRHIPNHPDYNANFRQLIHVAYKVAAEYSNVYINMIQGHEAIIGEQVTENIYERHLARLFNL